jgi:TolA-binding protein
MAEHHAIGMAQPCAGRPPPGGVEHNLRFLRRGINPNTRQAFRTGPYPEPTVGAQLAPSAVRHRGKVLGWGSGTEPENRKEGTASCSGARCSTAAQQKLQELKERVKQKEATRNEEQEKKRKAKQEEATRSGEQEKKRKKDAVGIGVCPGRDERDCEGQSATAEDRAGATHAVRKKIRNQLAIDCDQPTSYESTGRKRCFSEV